MNYEGTLASFSINIIFTSIDSPSPHDNQKQGQAVRRCVPCPAGPDKTADEDSCKKQTLFKNICLSCFFVKKRQTIVGLEPELPHALDHPVVQSRHLLFQIPGQGKWRRDKFNPPFKVLAL